MDTEYLQERMLFVRTANTFETMAKAPLIIAGLILVFLAMPIQSSFGSIRTLDLTVNQDGTAHISSKFPVESADFEVDLFGSAVDNFVAVGDGNSPLSVTIMGNRAIFDSVSSSHVTVTYDTHDLVSKEGRIWTFYFDAPSDYSLLMPVNSVIVGMSVVPDRMDLIDEQVKLELATGSIQIDYIFGTQPDPRPLPPPAGQLEPTAIGIITGVIIAAGITTTILLKRRRSSLPTQTSTVTQLSDPQTIFSTRHNMRDDDKKIVEFIYENNGQIFESDLRKKFLQPKTTMWRAVKRLERLGIVEIYKKDQQNMVKLRRELEDED